MAKIASKHTPPSVFTLVFHQGYFLCELKTFTVIFQLIKTRKYHTIRLKTCVTDKIFKKCENSLKTHSIESNNTTMTRNYIPLCHHQICNYLQ
jgi:hypothetical protein